MSNYSDDGWGDSPVKTIVESDNGEVHNRFNYVEEKMPQIVHEPIMQISPVQMTELDIPCLQPPASSNWAAPPAEMPVHQHAPIVTPSLAAEVSRNVEIDVNNVSPAASSQTNQQGPDPSQYFISRLLLAFANLGEEFVHINKEYRDYYGLE